MEFVTIATFSKSIDATPYKVNLENEGIYVFLKDEHTVTMAPIYEHAVGGIKLQVPIEDRRRAKQIMEDAGYMFETEYELPKFWRWFDRTTSRAPVIGNKNLLFRFITFLIIITLPIILLANYIISPSTTEILTTNQWCIDFIEYNGKRYIPNNTKQPINIVRIDGYNCESEIKINNNGYVILPGFNSNPIYGDWTFSRGIFKIGSLDTFQFLYEGEYKIKLNESQFILTSNTTIIHCSKIPPFTLP